MSNIKRIREEIKEILEQANLENDAPVSRYDIDVEKFSDVLTRLFIRELETNKSNGTNERLALIQEIDLLISGKDNIDSITVDREFFRNLRICGLVTDDNRGYYRLPDFGNIRIIPK